MKKLIILLFAVMTFAACGSNNNDPNDNATLKNTRWEYTVDATNTMYFEFESSTFTYHDVFSDMGITLDTWYRGTFELKGTGLTLLYKEASSADLKEAMAALPTTGTVNGNTLLYGGHSFTKSK